MTQAFLCAVLLAACAPAQEPPAQSDAARAQVAAVRLSPADWPAEEFSKYEQLGQSSALSNPLVEGGGGMIAATTGPLAIHAGLRTLEQGGSAMDAAIATALAQVVQVAGSWVSCAGIVYAVYYDAETGRVYSLNGGYDTVRAEDEPLTIPAAPEPSGRTALVPGFMAGIEAAHRRFGKLPWSVLFEPALYLAEEGFPVSPVLAALIRYRQDVLGRLPETRALFTREDGSFHEAGDHFRQPQLAATLRHAAAEGASWFYTGDWARHFVDAVQREGGKMTLDDLKAYRAEWGEPLHTSYRDFVVHSIGFPELGSVQLMEALNLLELRDLRQSGHYSRSAASLFDFIQICRLGYVVSYSAAYRPMPGENSPIPEIAPEERIKKESARRNLERLKEKGWELALYSKLNNPPAHSDGIVVVDANGNVAAVVHSINTTSWGSTGLFVDGVSIPDSACFQQAMIAKAGPGRRLPNIVNPVIVLRESKPVLAASSIGSALHESMLQHLVDVLDFGMNPKESVDSPRFWAPYWSSDPGLISSYAMQTVDAGAFPKTVVQEVRERGQPLKELELNERSLRISYWVGIQIDPESGLRRGCRSSGLNGIVEATEPR